MPTGEDEFVIYVHGYLEDLAGGGENQAKALQVALRKQGYRQPVVAALWDSNTLNWWKAKDAAERAGRELAGWIDDYLAGYPDTTVRVVGHSLGGRAAYAMLSALESDLASVSTLGAASDPDAVCRDGKWGSAIAGFDGPVYNFHSTRDGIVCRDYALLEFTPAVGCVGAACDGLFTASSPPGNYRDVDVSTQVDHHCDYYRAEVGCVPQLVERFE
ncbi:MAG: esterase/lipase family protein [Haloarculaceae archaeon]